MFIITVTSEDVAMDGVAVGVILTFLAFTLLFIWLGMKMKAQVKRLRRFSNYSNLIFVGNIKSINEIAASMNILPHIAKKELQRMVGDGFLLNVAIDVKNNVVVVKEKPVVVNVRQQTPLTSNITTDCISCGASGQTNQCEYCGSVVK